MCIWQHSNLRFCQVAWEKISAIACRKHAEQHYATLYLQYWQRGWPWHKGVKTLIGCSADLNLGAIWADVIVIYVLADLASCPQGALPA